MTTQELLWQDGQRIVMDAPELYVDVDVEADGIAGHGSMLSIGAISPTGETYYSEIRPEYPDFIPKSRAFCERHGLERDRLFDEARPAVEVMEEFRDWTQQMRKQVGKVAVFTAFNASFDWSFTDLYFTKAGLENPYHLAPLDLKSLALPLADWEWKRTKKINLPKQIVPPGDFAHHALEDARYQQKIHFGLAAVHGAAAYNRLWLPNRNRPLPNV